MNKVFNHWFAAVAAMIMAASALYTLNSCSDEQLIADEATVVSTAQQIAAAPVYHISIPANLNGEQAQSRAIAFEDDYAHAKFTDTDNLYLYNQTKKAWAHDGTAFIALRPTFISPDNQSCIFETDKLKFANGAIIESGDTIRLFYNMSKPDLESDSYFDYAEG